MTTAKVSTFTDSVAISNPAALDNMTVTLDLVDQQAVSNLSIVLMAPNGKTITLVRNQINAAGTVQHRRGASERQLHRCVRFYRGCDRYVRARRSVRSSTTTPPEVSSIRPTLVRTEIARPVRVTSAIFGLKLAV